MIKIRCCTVLWIQSVSARSVDTDQLTNTRNGVAQARTGNKPRPALYILESHWLHLNALENNMALIGGFTRHSPVRLSFLNEVLV